MLALKTRTGGSIREVGMVTMQQSAGRKRR